MDIENTEAQQTQAEPIIPPVFNYDQKTGLYVGESLADPSPLEPGVFLVPRHATLLPPPDDIPLGSAAFWRASAWQIEVIPESDDDLNGVQDAPQGFKETAAQPGYFKRLARAVVGK